MPKVTAVLPCHNAEAFIGATLANIASLTWPNLEILVGEDCSTDGTAAIVRDFIAGDPRFRLIERKVNLGWIGNSNDLMAQASGEFIFFAFHDDLIAPDFVEQTHGALRDRPEAVLAFGALQLTEVDGRSWVLVFDAMDHAETLSQRTRPFINEDLHWWIAVHGLFRSRAVQKVGGLKPHEEGEYFADWHWLLHMAILGEFVRVDGLLVWKNLKSAA